MHRPFRNIEMQTMGVLIDNPVLRFLRNHVGVNTVSMSLFAFKDDDNEKCRIGPKLDIGAFCQNVKVYDFTLRLSVNLTHHFNDIQPDMLFNTCRGLGADQVTLRKLYSSWDDRASLIFRILLQKEI
ncbi:MAG: hypothetical protein LBP76_10580 [Treponema sp.]|nr:hypothetical protein [Treponema sp.]